MSDEDFDRAMHDADWAEVYQRQAARGGLVDEFADLLGLEAGDTVIELGCGPGHATERLADRVKPGRVVGVDRHVGALRYLEAETDADLDHVEAVVGDAERLPLRLTGPTPALAAFVLHHVAAPWTAVASVGTALAAGSPLLVVEYDPDAPGEYGPPTAHRLDASSVESWLSTAGFDVEETAELPEEKYAILARRR